MGIRVHYFTESPLDKNKVKTTSQFERTFASLEDAKAAPLPEGCVFAYIRIDDDYHTFTPSRGWEFNEQSIVKEIKESIIYYIAPSLLS